MHLRLLKTFLAVAESGNVTRAAEHVFRTQSTVSDQIQSLEADMGAALFTRTRQGLFLTPAGEALKAYAGELLDLAHEARTAVEIAADDSTKTLTIGALETIGAARLPQWLAAFHRQQPDVRIDVKIASSGALLNGIADGSLDAALCFDTGVVDEHFIKHAVLREPLILVAPLLESGLTELCELTPIISRRFITTEQGCIYRQMLDNTFAEAGAQPLIAAEVGSIAAIGRLVAAGVGIALVPRLAVEDLLVRGEVIELPWPGADRTAPLVLMQRRRRVLSPVLKRLLSAIDELSGSTVKSADARRQYAGPSLS